MDLKEIINKPKKKWDTWRADLTTIEIQKKESYVQGSNDAADNFLKLNSELLKQVEILRRENISMRDELHKEYAEKEKELREQGSTNLKQVEDAHDNQCALCSQSMDSERTRFKTRQMYLSKIINDIEILWQHTSQKSGIQIEEAEKIVTSAARMAAIKTDLISDREKLDKIIKDAVPYLNLGLQDGTVDMLIEYDKKLGISSMIPDHKQIEKKDGGLV